jgi:hypothetical protein
MASNDNSRDKLLTTGGILNILAGIIQINNGVMLMAYFLNIGMRPYWAVIPFLPGLSFDYRHYLIPAMVGWRPSILFFIVGLLILVFGILAVIGGISALRRRRFGLSLTGAISALASGLLGILAIIFVALGKREFGAEKKEMASNGNDRGRLLTAGGVLSIVAGILKISNAIGLAMYFLAGRMPDWTLLPFLPGAHVDYWRSLVDIYFYEYFPVYLIIVGVLLLLGILAIVGGVSAIRRKRFGLSLAGAICALISGLLGILAVIFVALGKREFGVERKENEV